MKNPLKEISNWWKFEVPNKKQWVPLVSLAFVFGGVTTEMRTQARYELASFGGDDVCLVMSEEVVKWNASNDIELSKDQEKVLSQAEITCEGIITRKAPNGWRITWLGASAAYFVAMWLGKEVTK